MVKILCKRNNVLVVWLVLFVCMLLWSRTATQRDDTFPDNTAYLSDGWQVHGDKDNAEVIYARTIAGDLGGKTLGFFAYDAFIDIDADGEPIYHYGQTSRYLKSPGTGYHFVDIPQQYLGRTLTVKISYVYTEKYVEDYTFEVGRSADLIIRHLKREMIDLFVNITLLALSVVLLFLYVLQKINKQDLGEVLFLALLTICFVFWSGGNTFIHQFLFPYAIERYYLYYGTLYLLPILIICYLETISEKLQCEWVFWSHALLIFVITLLHFLRVAEMTQTLIWFCVFAGAELVVVVARLCKARDVSKVRFYAFNFWVVTILLNAAWYLLNSAKGVSIVLSKFGMCIYIAVVVLQSAKEMINNLATAKNAELLKVKAYTDNLTGLGNRYAFDEQIRQEKLERLVIVSLDVNNLKYYNDNFGHICGDQLIARTAFILKSVFDKVYRTGGDEFVAVLTDKNDGQMEEYRQKVRELAEKGSTDQMKIQIACGYSAYQNGDYSYEDILRRADTLMYDDKKELKRLKV